jgi:sodium/bile acid cotransporter 7
MTGRGTILLSVYSAFSSAVLARIWHQVPVRTLFLLILVCTVLLAALLYLANGVARVCGFDRADRISIVFCGSNKSLISGIPMARVLYAGPQIGMTILPLILFHQIQLLVCAWLAR